MNPARLILRVLLLAVVALLASCIDGREEYWLDANGGGRAEASYQLPAAVARMHGGEQGIRRLLEDFLESTPEIHSGSCEVATRDGRVHVSVRAAFHSALELKNIASGEAMRSLPSAATHIAGNVRAGIRGRTLEFQRTIDPARALPGAALLPAAQVHGHRLTYIMHLPEAALESNATRVEDAGRTLVWEFPLEKALAAPLTTRFRMRVPIPWGTVTALALPLTLAGGLTVARLRKSRRRGAGRPDLSVGR